MLHRSGTSVRVPAPLLIMGRVVLFEPLVLLRCDTLLRVGEHVEVNREGEVVVHLVGGERYCGGKRGGDGRWVRRGGERRKLVE